ncbi:MAG TPA: trypsin-like peptidase domain-containing protein [Gemmatimonas sp.]|nr:trypsin-like peptidase domain-containing protein [Gemmatimonas sp.]
MTADSSPGSLTLSQLSDALADAVSAAAGSVVAVDARPRLASTGVHWRDGLIVTTAATVRREHGITVTLPSGRSVPATLVGGDAAADIAVLRLDTNADPSSAAEHAVADDSSERPTAAVLGDSATLKPGHLVLALARIDDSGPRVGFGAVSAVGGPWRSWKGGEYSQLVQSGLTLHPGFGGGPLVDAQGRVLGINSGGISRHFATTIPTLDVERVVKHVVEQGYVPRGWLGAAMQSVAVPAVARERGASGSDMALLVVDVVAGGPAATAGLIVGDIILAMDDAPVREPNDLLRAVGSEAVGRTIVLALWRGGAAATVSLTVGERPQHEGRSRRR